MMPRRAPAHARRVCAQPPAPPGRPPDTRKPAASLGNFASGSTPATARASPPPPVSGAAAHNRAHSGRPAAVGAGRAARGPEAPSSARGARLIFKKNAPHSPAPSAAGAGREGEERGRLSPPSPPPRRRRRRLPASAAPLPRWPLPRAPARPAQAARVCFAARPPPPRASRAHLCLAGPHSSLPSVECLSRWLLRTVWLFPLVTAFTFCLNSSPRSRPSPARRLPPPPAACAPAPPPAAGAPPLATWGPAPRSPPPPSRRPSPAPSARWGYNCLSPPGGVILGVVGGGGGGGEEGNFLVPPFPGGGSGVGGHRFQWLCRFAVAPAMNESPLAPHPHQRLVFSVFQVLTTLIGTYWKYI
ncbi:F-box-like/WD repeat-containing protein TBL1XR1 isoform X3 [Trachypithecus francoisi]|uniref:F-box-like/WD repeat-containing protein TBL1XR1 isoform X3 n=1 Tax=Trachypithecus francoisi TaxID=54180 RepID=UPI00141B8AA0|nr:F-box-like/WD repeat-containing protein TBL1XR1 isoform X3 [Trachypithecus francoisi]